MPVETLAYMQNTGLDAMILRNLGDLEVDDTVALVLAVRLGNRVAEYLTNRIFNRIEITLTVDDRIFILAERDVFGALRCRNDGQVDTIDTIRVVYGLVGILVLLGLADRVLQRFTAPEKRQRSLTNRGIQFVQIGREYNKGQLFHVRTAAFCRSGMRVGTGLRQHRVMVRIFVQLIGPGIRQFGVCNRV